MARTSEKYHVERMVANGPDDCAWEEVGSTYHYHDALQLAHRYKNARVSHYLIGTGWIVDYEEDGQ